MTPIIRGILWGVAAFVITLLLMIVIAALLAAGGLASAAAIFNNFGWLLALVVGILYFFKGSGTTNI